MTYVCFLTGFGFVCVCVCRCKQALLELRHLKSEAREATKLLEDKKVLEVKVRLLVCHPLQPLACWVPAAYAYASAPL